MLDHSAAMIAFVKLAGIAQSKRQLLQCDKFLILAAAAACHAGWLAVAERCRRLVLGHNPAHLLRQYPTLPDALRDEDFQVFFRQLQRFCSYERAEHFLTELEIAPGFPVANTGLTSGEYALLLLGKSDAQAAD